MPFFQLKNAEPEELLKELDLHHESLKRRLYSSDGKMLSLEDVDFGAHFTNEMKKYQESHENSLRVSLDLKRRCYDFLMKLLDDVKMRLPNNKSAFKGMRWLAPKTVLSQTDRLVFSELPLQHLMGNKNNIENQYRKIMLHIWKEEDIFKDGFPSNDSVSFWTGIKKI
ncbi:hypothetical protein AVEN_272342-1 [Araneus ventricosus]|uniref:Uncharacterized protein n=1 Tax=Araneus ventricosus TaxID=182803 RepID=A0A4Y2GQT7_ARAVE|nr:hypothetical protein AVEN_272342-1 [Araneus ventricosus]